MAWKKKTAPPVEAESLPDFIDDSHPPVVPDPWDAEPPLLPDEANILGKKLEAACEMIDAQARQLEAHAQLQTKLENEIAETQTRLQDKLDAACEVMEAQARLLEAYELRRPRVQALARLADARKAWEEVNG